MRRHSVLRTGIGAAALMAVAAVAAVTWLRAQERPEARPEEPAANKSERSRRPSAPKAAPSRVTAVTVYQNNALVTREVDVPEGEGSFELVVTPLPPQTVNNSLYSEGADGIRVLTTRFRSRPIKEDTREEVRKLEAQLKEKNDTAQRLQADMKAVEQNLAMLSKLENFTSVTTASATEKGQLNGDNVITLSKYVMDQ